MSVSPTAIRTAQLAGALTVLTLVALLVEAFAPAWRVKARSVISSTKVQLAASASVLLVFAGLLLANTAFPGYLDQAEPNIVTTAWLVRQGEPLYHTFESANRYSLLYGPGTYLPYAAALLVGGGATLSAKLMVLLANVVMGYFLWRAYRSLFDAPRALVMLAVVLLFILVPRPNHYLFQARADILIMSATAVALFGASRRTGVVGPVALALATAFIVDAKATAVIYVIPLFAMLLQRRGWRVAFAVGFAAMVAAVGPFLLPNVSITQYAQWLRRATGHPSAIGDLMSTLRTLPILLAPLLLILGPTPWKESKLVGWLRENWLVSLALLPCVALAVMASTRIGAGSHHLLPFVPLLGYLYAELQLASGGQVARSWPRLSFYGSACLALVVLVRVSGGLIDVSSGWFFWHDATALRDELRWLLAHHGAGRVAMGYGDTTSRLTYARPELVFAGPQLVVDDVALSDMSMDGMPIPSTTVAALASCATPVWLIPRGQRPFLVPSLFANDYPSLVGREPLFSAPFREAFSRHYSKAQPTAHFDVWICSPS